ncbi:MAG: hypothetical protein IJU35_08075 [Paludibacteraceae bacterium]|nr:hypothetical protein [Paludibacteraceae bacterium]
MRKYLIIILLSTSLTSWGRADSLRTGFFRYSPATQSLLADINPHFLRFDVAGATNHSEYDYGQTDKAYRIGFYGNIGVNIPVFWANIKSAENQRRKGENKDADALSDSQSSRFAIGLTMPVQAQIWLDLLEPRTSPVVDTDYRIGLPIWTFLHRLNRGFAKNYAITFAPFTHESTHLGDELALQHRRHGLPIERVNVSANWWELQFTLNAEEDRLTQNHCFRVGLVMLWNPKSGWYFIDENEGDPTLARKKRSPWEAYLQYQYQSPAKKGFQGVASIEIRNRALLGYPSFTWHDNGAIDYAIQKEKRIFTYNVFIGFRYNNLHYTGLFSRFSAGLRLYHGSNPYGQFRNQKNYNQFGLCLIVE